MEAFEREGAGLVEELEGELRAEDLWTFLEKGASRKKEPLGNRVETSRAEVQEQAGGVEAKVSPSPALPPLSKEAMDRAARTDVGVATEERVRVADGEGGGRDKNAAVGGGERGMVDQTLEKVVAESERLVASLQEQLSEVTGRTDARLAHVISPLYIACYYIAEQPAPAPHFAHPEECAALRKPYALCKPYVLVTVPRVSRVCEHFPDGFDLHLLE